MAKILEMLTSRKFWLTVLGTISVMWVPYLNGALGLKEALAGTLLAILNYVFQLGKEDAAKIAAGTAKKPA